MHVIIRTVDDDAPHTGEHKSDLVTRLNPRGQLPVYEEGDIVIPDSLASIIWIEEQHSKSGTPLLTPVSDRKHRALVRIDKLADASLLLYDTTH